MRHLSTVVVIVVGSFVLVPAAAHPRSDDTVDSRHLLGQLEAIGEVIIIAADRVHLGGRFGTLLTCTKDGSSGSVVVLSGSSRSNPAQAKIKHQLTECRYADLFADEELTPLTMEAEPASASRACQRLDSLEIGVDACSALSSYLAAVKTGHGRIIFKADLVDDPYAAGLVAIAWTENVGEFSVERKPMTLAYITGEGAVFTYGFHYEDWRYNPSVVSGSDGG